MRDCVVLSFTIEPLKEYKGGMLTLTPVLNGTRLTELVMQFEQEHGFDSAGGYAGIVPSLFSHGPLDRYFMAEPTGSYWARLGGYYVLGCKCGEVGCWPLVCQITKISNTIVWDAFRQPHRPDRDYSHFGPFSFDLEQYKTVVSEIASQFEDPRQI